MLQDLKLNELLQLVFHDKALCVRIFVILTKCL